MPLGKLMEALNSRELNELLEKIKANSGAIEAQNRIIADMRSELSALRSDLSGLRDSVSASVRDAASSVASLNEELSDSITDLKVLKSQLQSRVAEKIESEFRGLLTRFERDVDSISKLKQELGLLQADFAKMRFEVDKLSKISTGIKAADFELTNYARRLQADDAEKLRLMRQIDTLERLVSKLRRSPKQ